MNNNPFESATVAESSLFSTLSPVEKKQSELRGHLAAMIYNERKSRKMTQAEFAGFMGVTQAMVSKWESCSCNFSVDTLLSIADKLGFDVTIDLFPAIKEDITVVVSPVFYQGTAGSCYYEDLSNPENLITLGG